MPAHRRQGVVRFDIRPGEAGVPQTHFVDEPLVLHALAHAASAEGQTRGCHGKDVYRAFGVTIRVLSCIRYSHVSRSAHHDLLAVNRDVVPEVRNRVNQTKCFIRVKVHERVRTSRRELVLHGPRGQRIAQIVFSVHEHGAFPETGGLRDSRADHDRIARNRRGRSKRVIKTGRVSGEVRVVRVPVLQLGGLYPRRLWVA